MVMIQEEDGSEGNAVVVVRGKEVANGGQGVDALMSAAAGAAEDVVGDEEVEDPVDREVGLRVRRCDPGSQLRRGDGPGFLDEVEEVEFDGAF